MPSRIAKIAIVIAVTGVALIVAGKSYGADTGGVCTQEQDCGLHSQQATMRSGEPPSQRPIPRDGEPQAN